MHRQTLIFLLSHKITTVQQKTANRNNQSNQPIRKNNPRNHSIKNTQKTVKTNTKTISSINRKINHTNNHSKQSTQPLKKHAQNKHDIQSNNTPRFLNIKIIAG